MTTILSFEPPALWRRLVAEFLGTGMLVTVVVGSGVMATRLSPNDVGLQLLENSTATALALAVLILVLGPVSGAHLNPLVSVVGALAGRGASNLGRGAALGYVVAQTGGAIGGALLADAMFGIEAAIASTARLDAGTFLGEVVATAGLIVVILGLSRTALPAVTALAVGGYIGAAYWFTSSTSFANPAVTVGRIFSDTFAGIAPGSAAGFVAAQILGGALGFAVTLLLFPRRLQAAADRVVPTPAQNGTP